MSKIENIYQMVKLFYFDYFEILVIFCYVTTFPIPIISQSYYTDILWSSHEVFIDEPPCSCALGPICQSDWGDPNFFSASYEGVFFAGGYPSIAQKDPLTCEWFWVTPQWPDLNLTGLVTTGEGKFYAIEYLGSNAVYEIDVVNSSYSIVGNSPYAINNESADLCLYNGEVYYLATNGIVRLNTEDPTSSVLIPTTIDLEYYKGLTASPWCNSLLATKMYGFDLREIHLINILDGSISVLCALNNYLGGFTSMLEYTNPAPCSLTLDLDCNDDNSTSYFDCLSTEGVPVADEDIRLFADDWMEEMTITIGTPVPDAPDEVLIMTGAIPNIDATGSGTEMITLSNLGGASIEDFKAAVHLIRYQNLSPSPTAGTRTIEAQFTTAAGSVSDIAVYFVEVSDIPSIPVDLGPDTEICDGSTLTLDAGNPGATYAWSTGDATQTITVDQSGQYIVTVSDGINCPGMDTVLLEVLPNIDVSLAGDTYICDNESATLIVQTDTPFTLDIEIQADPGSSFSFTDVTGTFTFTDLPPVPTTYTITSVTPSQGACITLSDPVQFIDVFPSYSFEVDTALCEGDSIWLGFFWETDAGTYENMLQTFDGCDSFVTTHITLLPAVQIAINTTTCSASAAGVFVTHLNNPNGCDTVVTTTVILLTLDTTFLMTSSCNIEEVGMTTLIEDGSDGCDSIIITTTDYIPPVDTTFLFQKTCDSSLLGVVNEVVSGIDGCDSLIITTVTFADNDTTYLFATTCDSMQMGIIQDTAVAVNGCDSIIITTTTFSLSDTTYLFATSCNPSDVGVLEVTITGSNGCDSLVITTVSFAEQDSVFLTGITCDPMQAGVTTEALINQFGCDSIVTTTTSLLPSDTIYLTGSSCLPADTGVMTAHYLNQFGCDSMVITTVSLLPSDQTFLNETTCQASQAGMFITSHLNQYGCDSVVTLTVELLEADTTQLFFETCDSSEVGVVSFVESGSDGCDSIVIETTTLFPLPILDVLSAIDYNGFDISCTDEPDGSVIAIITGTGPYIYLWSTTDTDQEITGLSAGDYAVTITDGNGCTASDVITLEEPTELMMGFEVTEPDCFDQALGVINVSALGGVAPYQYAIDGGLFQDASVFNALGDGIYQLTVMDANQCTASDIIAIDIPLTVQVDLGDNQVISLGDSALLEAIINLPFDSIANLVWTGLDTGACANCLTQIAAPVITTAYSVSLTSVDGCADADSITISVTTDQQLYIPNIFSPNGDGINDVLRITADAGVREISVMEIYDRWGNLVFGFEHKAPDDLSAHWDGLFNGQTLNPGVFTYKAVILYTSGDSEVRYGDVTLIR